MLTDLALQELVFEKKSKEKVIVYFENSKSIQIHPSDLDIEMKPVDLNVYLWILNKTATGHFALTTALELSRELGYSTGSQDGNKEASAVSKSLIRLKKTGYISILPSFRNSKIIPHVRLHSSSEKSLVTKINGKGNRVSKFYDHRGGFIRFLEKEEQDEVFSKGKSEQNFKHSGSGNLLIKSFSNNFPRTIIEQKVIDTSIF